mgnify:CR=1 FL=1
MTARARAARAIGRASVRVARAEAAAAAGLALAVCALVLLNVATRSLGAALYWVDEAAIYAMIWSAFLGASVTVHRRSAISIDLLADALPPRGARVVAALGQVAILVFGLALLVVCWRWYDPLGLAAAGFAPRAFAAETFNFIYREPTLTLGLPKWPVWLVMPLFAAGVALHAAANLVDPDRAAPRAPRAELGEVD